MKLTIQRWAPAALCLAACIAWMGMNSGARAQGLTTTTVQGTVYLANGRPGSGTLQLSWPAFTTANNQAVAAGRTNVTIGPDGYVSVRLSANLGATPAGLYYTAVYHLSDGTTSTEYWVVPAAAQASISQVRAQVMPAAQAVQAVSKGYVDQSIAELTQSLLTASGGSLSGPLFLNGDPTQPAQAATKRYVDNEFANALPSSGGVASGPLTSVQLGAAYQVDQFSGADFGAKLQACLSKLDAVYGGTCDARNFSGTQTISAAVVVSTANATVQLPCATIASANQIRITAGTRNVTFHGCALRGASNASGSQGGTVLLYSGAGPMIQVGDPSYAADTMGFHIDNMVVNTTASTDAKAQGIGAFRTQEMNLEGLYLLGNSNQTGMTLDGTGNYTGGTFQDIEISGFGTALNAVGHQVANAAPTDWVNASTFVRLHINCPTSNGSPVSGTYGINLVQGDGNTFTGGDVEGCGTALHLGPNAQNNTIVGLRNENSIKQIVADTGSSYNNWITGGTMFTGQLTDNGTRNSFLDTFHRSFNGLNGDWYGSQQDATVTNHYRIGTGTGNERGLLNRYQTDYGYRWTTGLSDASAGQQFYQVLDELNNVYRLSIGQYNHDQASTNNQTVINAAGTGAVVLNGSANAGSGGVIFGSGGLTGAPVAAINGAGNAQFNGTLQVGGASTFANTTTVKNQSDGEIDSILWAGASANQKESFVYKDYSGASQWYMVKDANNNWALNSGLGGLNSFKAYQSNNSGDTYVNASNGSGHIRLNYEPGAGTETDIYSGPNATLVAAFLGSNGIKFPGLAAASGHNCVQIDNSGYISNTGAACTTSGLNGTVNTGSAGQVAYYAANGTVIAGTNSVAVNAGGTGATTAAQALANLGAQAAMPGVVADGASGVAVGGNVAATSIVSSVNNVYAITAAPYSAKCDVSTQTTSITINTSGVVSGYSFAATDIGKQLIAYGSTSTDNFVLLAWGTLSVSGTTGTISPAPTGNITSTNWKYGTDDQAAIQAAFTAAGSKKKVEIPAGSCLTSTITDRGTPFYGHGATLSSLVGMPGMDTLAGPDSAITYPADIYHGYVQIVVDKSVDASMSACSTYTCTTAGGVTTYLHPSGHTITVFPNRISGTAGGTTPLDAAHGGPPAPGPAIFGPGGGSGSCSGTVTSGSTTFTLPCYNWSDMPLSYLLGMPITVTTSGGSVTTTVTAKLNNTDLTLATSWPYASSTIASGTLGAGHQAPWYFGNSASAYPQSDQSAAIKGLTRWTWDHVQFVSNSGAHTDHHEIGLFLQTQPYAYMLRDVTFINTWGGKIEALPALNFATQPWTPDDSVEDNVQYFFCAIPEVRYNGTARRDGKISVYAANNPFFLGMFWFSSPGNGSSGNIGYYYHEGWSMNSGEQERFVGSISIADGKNDVTSYAPPNDQYFNLLTTNGSFTYPFGEAIHVTGNGNRIVNTNTVSTYVVDSPGLDNKVSWTSNSSGNSRQVSSNRARPEANQFDSSFLLAGSSGAPFTNGSDLGSTCAEWNFSHATAFGNPGCVSEISSVRTTNAAAGNTNGTYAHMLVSGHTDWCVGSCGLYGTLAPKNFTVGDRLPMASGVIAVVIGRCDATCTQVVTVKNYRTNATLKSATLTFGTTWTVQTLGPIDLSGTTSVLGDIANISAASVAGSGVTYEDLQFVGYEPQNADTIATAVAQSNASAAALYAPLASPAFTGTPTAPTATSGTSTTQLATTAFVQSAVNSASGAVCSKWWTTPGVPTSGAVAFVQNQTRMWDFNTSCSITPSTMIYALSTADNTANVYDFGFYNESGTELCHVTGPGTTLAAATGIHAAVALTGTCNLLAGTRYYFAITTNCASSCALMYSVGPTLRYVNNAAPSAGSATISGLLNGSITPPTEVPAYSGGIPLFGLHN